MLLLWTDIERGLVFCAPRVRAIITEKGCVVDGGSGVDADRFDALLVGSSVRRGAVSGVFDRVKTCTVNIGGGVKPGGGVSMIAPATF